MPLVHTDRAQLHTYVERGECGGPNGNAQGSLRYSETTAKKGGTMLGGLAAIVAMVGGTFLIFTGIDVFGCRSVSFSSDFTTCYPSDLGMMSGAIAGGGLVVAGAAVFMFALVRLATIK